MAKRVNKKFLLALTVVVVGMAMALLVVIFLTRHRSPAQSIAAAKKAVADGRYDDAATNYRARSSWIAAILNFLLGTAKSSITW